MIPLSVPNLTGNELKYVSDCINTGWISTAGEYVNLFENSIKDYTDTNYAVACMNGTVGLQTAINLLDPESTDIILTTNLTFVATLNAINYCRLEAILFDIDESTWQIDTNLLEEWLEENTHLRNNGRGTASHTKEGRKIAAILPVHVLGGLVDMDHLLKISRKYHIPIIEDSTEALGSTLKGKQAGTFGEIGVYSFNGNKIISTGGGGMIVTDNALLAKRAKHLTTTAKTDPMNYFHDEVGYNYRLVNVLAAIGVAQMENFTSILKRKQNIDKIYKTELKDVEDITFQKHIKGSNPNSWLFTFRTPKMRDLLQYLNKNGIQSRPFWTPMNQLPMYSKIEYFNKMDITSRIYSDCISIPSSSNLSQDDQSKVIKAIRKYYNK